MSRNAFTTSAAAVPGLRQAKPIIDILIEVTSLETLDGLNGEMRAIGYEPREVGHSAQALFAKGRRGSHTHQVHAFLIDDSHVTRHLTFRDYLRAHPEAVWQSTELKISVIRNATAWTATAKAKTPTSKRLKAHALQTLSFDGAHFTVRLTE